MIKGAGWRELSLLAILLSSGACLCMACGDDESGEEVKLDWVLHSTVLDEDAGVVEGVKLCAEGNSSVPCVETDALGIANLALPSERELIVSYEKDGFITKLRQVTTKGEPPAGLGAWILQRRTWYEEQLATLLGASAVDLDGRGMISLQTSKEVDAKPTVTPWVTGENFGEIPLCVVNGKGGLCQGDPLTKYNAWAFVNLAPDDYTGTITGPNLTCTPKGFACKDKPGCVNMTVQAGKVTHAGMDCQ